MRETKLKNGFTPIENLKICIAEGTATAETFEAAIKDEGLICEIIILLSDYYKHDLEGWKEQFDEDENRRLNALVGLKE